ncbi:aminoglycoside adenylyltransferase family protein [Streptomyces glaucescens]|uniref:aminoglycoside adenylyltransferase family protein n=1 Tax=Streptomyces glaucescens TaxID=1907 RepID=UPI000A3C2D33|nr:aminoglycoside adenylyltransferase family protein [Streptomyces glaucescens]
MRDLEQVQEVVRLVGRVLGSEAVGVYPHGSGVLGGLRPASDLDVLVVTRRRMNGPERRALLDGLLNVSGPGGPGGPRPVELTVVVHSEVRPWRFPPTADFLYGEWLREEFMASGPPAPESMPDLALLITIALSGGHPLSGPPPARVLDPVPPVDLARASVAGLPDLLAELDRDTRNVVLTLARVWTTLATGEIRPKDAAADWALPRLRPAVRPVLEHARELYLTRHYSEETWSGELRARVRPYADAVLAEIGRLAPG